MKNKTLIRLQMVIAFTNIRFKFAHVVLFRCAHMCNLLNKCSVKFTDSNMFDSYNFL